MAKVHCKMCGGRVEIPEGLTYAECPFCGTATTFPVLTDERKENLYNRAEQYRRTNDFDKALQTYEKILEIDSSDPEIYWGIVLCRFGIEYVEDPVSHERIPTCHRVQHQSILLDRDYRSALEHANGNEYAYETEAKRIAEIQKDILAISSREEPFDVFICYKENSDGGTRTKDSTDAQDIYYQLTNEGYRVFFARITLEDKLGQQYEPYIFAALNSAKVMLVIGSKKEYFESPWVKNEWSRFLALMKKDRTKLLIPCYRDMDAYDIPEELSMLQSQDMSKIGFTQDIQRGLKKVLAHPAAGSAQETENSNNSAASDIQKLIKQGYVEKELENYEALNKIGREIISLDPENIDGCYFQALSSDDMFRAKKIFERIIKLKPERAEYYISSAKTLTKFGYKYNKLLQSLCGAKNNFSNGVPDQPKVQTAQDKLNSLIEILKFCTEQLRCITDEKVPGVKFTEDEKSEAVTLLIEIFDHLRYIYNQIYAHGIREHVGYQEVPIDYSTIRSLYASSNPFFFALATRNLSLIEKSLDEGCDVNSRNEFGVPALVIADSLNDDGVVRFLIERGADVNAACRDTKSTILHKQMDLVGCYDIGKPGLVRFLLEHGADPNLLDSNNDTPLSIACQVISLDRVSPESIECIDCLLKYGADPNYTNNGYTPLLQAVQNPNMHELVRVLLENEADYKIVSPNSGGSAMDYAKGKQNISYLKQVGCQKLLDFDPVEYDSKLAVQKEAAASPIRLEHYDVGAFYNHDFYSLMLDNNCAPDNKASVYAMIAIRNVSGRYIRQVHVDLFANGFGTDSYTNGGCAPGKDFSFHVGPLFNDQLRCYNFTDVYPSGAVVEFDDGSSQAISGDALQLGLEKNCDTTKQKKRKGKENNWIFVISLFVILLIGFLTGFLRFAIGISVIVLIALLVFLIKKSRCNLKEERSSGLKNIIINTGILILGIIGLVILIDSCDSEESSPSSTPPIVQPPRPQTPEDRAEDDFKKGQNAFDNEDYYEAVKWYRKAAEQGHAFAQTNLGLCYEEGKGVSQDYYEAVKWYRKAAEQGQADAQHNLGVCYYNGRGVSQNTYEAIKWFRKAAEQGNLNAKAALKVIQSR